MDLILKDISKAYGENQVLDHISLTFPQGSRTCVMAPSGRGKTTLLRVILGLTKPDQGIVTGRPAKIAAVFQEDRLCGNLTVGGNLRMVCGTAKRTRSSGPCLSPWVSVRPWISPLLSSPGAWPAGWLWQERC